MKNLKRGVITLHDIRNILVHIHSVEEGCDVVAWFREQGYYTRALKPSDYVSYPYFGIDLYGGEFILTGFGDPSRRHDYIVEYEDWLNEYVSGVDIDEASFYEVLNLGFEVANNG